MLTLGIAESSPLYAYGSVSQVTEIEVDMEQYA
jgi:hypothetical protein